MFRTLLALLVLAVVVEAIQDAQCTCGIVKDPVPSGSTWEERYKRHKYPWIVRIDANSLMPNGSVVESICNGVLIDPQHVLTSKLCMASETGTLIVHVGRHKISNRRLSIHNLLAKPQTIRAMPGSNVVTIKHNFMIVRLNKKVKTTPICMPPKDLKEETNHFGTEDAVLIGWVNNEAKNRISQEPRETNLQAQKFNKFDEVNSYYDIIKFQKFAIEPSDLGRPLMRKINGRWYLDAMFTMNSDNLNDSKAVANRIGSPAFMFFLEKNIPEACYATMN